MRRIVLLGLAIIFAGTIRADEPEPAAQASTAASETPATEGAADGVSGPRAMSGMSILGNEEAPKSLVIIPWKSSELGENIDLSNTLGDDARPVDRDVFLRELRFYSIRESE